MGHNRQKPSETAASRQPSGITKARRGAFFSVNLSRTYKDEAGNYHESDSFSGSELLRIAHLASRAYDQVSLLRQAEASGSC